LVWLAKNFALWTVLTRIISASALQRSPGSMGAVIVLLTWMYASGFFVLVGGEINAEIEHASASGKDPGEKAPS
jgi:uncharacterized BrkB/YihY/UPF0761 family membrane protein